ncbi:hypothetical protein Godav_015874 [Gossypium davidsonii]|uniref:ACT domain-containing protein ACR n=2 Tax=Gossypium TaxID=3633 RepID=A0A7J8RQY9_GOSDV|nr:hypothetical protein [Gossypium davidsonii]MBA0669620.1 hypothetical protein [Gossypium klotzschianum]
MGILHDDVVLISQSDKEGEPSVITVNCPDKTGLGCDLCRILLFFGLSIVRGDVSTDGKWCYIVFWVVCKPTTRWELLKKRLVEACPCCSSASEIFYYRSELQPPKPPDVFLLKLCCYDRKGLLHDVTEVLCNLELNIKKVSTIPDGTVIDLFFVTDTRELLHTKIRQEETYKALEDIMQRIVINFNIEKVGPEIAACSQASPFLPSGITEDIFHLEVSNELPSISLTSNNVSVMMDNSLSPAHTLVQIVCQDHKGLLYDIMRTLKDYSIQMELLQLLRVAVVSRGPDTELLVANPVELSSKGRPLVFYDITRALKMLNTCIFSHRDLESTSSSCMFFPSCLRYIVCTNLKFDDGRRLGDMIGDREWEVYRVLLDEGASLSIPRQKIEEGVWKLLMGWE